MAENNEIMIVDEQSLKDKIYTIRGQQVMLDFDLAEIYGYETAAFNQQVNRNIDRFDDDFMFRLTSTEFQSLMSQNVISSWGGRRKLPRAFTEQGIYMLMSVLKGDLAIRQSKALVRLFKAMKEYIIENQQLMITQRDYVALATQTIENTKDIKTLEANMVTKADLSDFMRLFDASIEHDEILILDGEPFKADLAYQKIYRKAKKNIVVIDDYISTKTLQHLSHAKKSVRLTIISDNKGKKLKKMECDDFLSEYPDYEVEFIQADGRAHDRYIIIDAGTKDIKMYHCGASSKDAGKKITTITEIKETSEYKTSIKALLANPPLPLK